MARRVRAAALLLALALCGSGCRSTVKPAPVTSLEGTVLLGPTAPVCAMGEACARPVEARFTLARGGRTVATFASDSTGHFRVAAEPGDYTVIPERPIGIGPAFIPVTVNSGGPTVVDLNFDTGIR